MATTTIPWSDGSGDNIYLTYSSASGDQTVTVSSDANSGSARTKVVTFSASGVPSVNLTINQDAGASPSYVSDGLVLWLDGKEKGGTTAWVDKVSGYTFTNYGATFNDDCVEFDGVDDYLRGANPDSSVIPSRTGGTIEVVCDFTNWGVEAGCIFIPRANSKMCACFGSTGGFFYGIDNTSSRNYYFPISSLSKASFSVSSERYYENGSPMTLSSTKNYFSGISTSYNLIGKRNNSSTPRFFKGKIYSIRIYNRQLTEAEVLANLAVDNARFNLGLTL